MCRLDVDSTILSARSALHFYVWLATDSYLMACHVYLSVCRKHMAQESFIQLLLFTATLRRLKDTLIPTESNNRH